MAIEDIWEGDADHGFLLALNSDEVDRASWIVCAVLLEKLFTFSAESRSAFAVDSAFSGRRLGGFSGLEGKCQTRL